MNNLKHIMKLKNITAPDLAKASGVSVSNIHRLITDPQVTPYKGTARKLAGVLSVTIAQIYGAQPAALNNEELFTQRTCDAAEAIVCALRDYAEKPVGFSLVINTRTKNGCDYYSIAAFSDCGMPKPKKYQKTAELKFDENGELVYAAYDNERRAR